MLRLSLSWSLIECSGCGCRRPRGLVCADCGARPAAHEIDPNLQRRQRVIRDALALLEGSQPNTSLPPQQPGRDARTEVTDLLNRINGLPNRVFGGLQLAIQNAANTQELEAALIELRNAAAQANRMTPQRPWVKLHSLAKAATEELLSSMRSFLEAARADSPIAAQQAANLGQEHLDLAAARIGELGECRTLLDIDVEAISAPTVALYFLRETERVAGSRHPLELDMYGHRAIEELFSAEVQQVFGLGIQSLILMSVSRAAFNEDTFNSTARSAFKAYRSSATRFQELINDEHLQADLTDANAHVMSGSLIAATLGAAALPDHAHITSLLDLARTFIESLGKRIVAALHAVQTNKRYSQLRERELSKILPAAQQGRYGDALTGLNLALRNASAHQDFSVSDGKIVLAPASPRPVRLTPSELVDLLLSEMEVVYANYIGLLAAAACEQVNLFDPRGLGALGLSESESISFILQLWEWDVTALNFDNRTLSIEAVVNDGVQIFLPLASIVPHQIPDSIEEVKVTLTDSMRRQYKLIGSVAPWVRYYQPGADQVVGLVEILGEWTLNGRLVMPRAISRRVLVERAAKAANENFPHSIAQLRRLREVSQRIGDSELAESFRTLITTIRCQAQGLALDRSALDNIERIQKWASGPSPDTSLLAGDLSALCRISSAVD
ncbi:hypothetical protein KALB_4236 [Kutzneria albida DSM 43870]|uniref:Uncharacterized protein n=1 Tax=Kutzneria albida DSM 43870 TaxID=1449976 RepID=W5WHE5_9PSEU|nr:hypothetical protein KALB_4236 [Kutzneria albida DSM 43870]